MQFPYHENSQLIYPPENIVIYDDTERFYLKE